MVRVDITTNRVAGFLNSLVNELQAQNQSRAKTKQQQHAGAKPKPPKSPRRPSTADAPSKPSPRSPLAAAHSPIRDAEDFRRVWGTPLTHSQMASYLQPARPRLSPREMHQALEHCRKADMNNWLMQKTGRFIPRNSMTEERRAALKEAFSLMDADNSGEIDFSELAMAMRALGFGREEIREAIAQGDGDGDGTLNFDEFVSLISKAEAKSGSSGGGGGAPSSADGNDAGTSFPFSLVADSYRITRLVDSFNPAVRDAALPLASNKPDEEKAQPGSPRPGPRSNPQWRRLVVAAAGLRGAARRRRRRARRDRAASVAHAAKAGSSPRGSPSPRGELRSRPSNAVRALGAWSASRLLCDGDGAGGEADERAGCEGAAVVLAVFHWAANRRRQTVPRAY